MTKYELKTPTPEMMEELIANMRGCDVDECQAAGMLTPREAVEQSIEMSPDAAAILVDGRCVVLFGVGRWSVLGLRGIPWLLTTEEAPKHAIRLIPLSREFIEDAKKHYTFLENYVDARNTKAIKWMKWLGFKVRPAKPFGPYRLPFHHFYWRA